MDLICLGQQNWDYCWTGKQHYMSRLARRGHRVLYIDPESLEDVTTVADSLRAIPAARTMFGVRTLAPGLNVYTHRHAPPLRWRINQRRRPHLVSAIAHRLGLRDPVVIAMYPTTERDLKHLRPRALLYFAVDEATGFGGMTEEDQRRVAAAEDRLLRRADVVLGVSPRLQRRFSTVNPRSYVLENGADVEHFAPERLARAAPHPLVARLRGPRLGFVGQVDERIDQPMLIGLARAHPEWQMVLAGRVKPRVDVSALAHEPNIHLLGYQPFEALPSILRDIDVCLVPYRLTPLTNSCSPLKVYEYLATGRPVVSTPLEAIAGYGDVVSLADSPADFERAVVHALARPEAGRERRLAFAAANNWERRVDVLEKRMEEAIEVRGSRRPRLHRPWGVSARTAAEPEVPEDDALPTAGPLSLVGRVAFGVFTIAGRFYHALRVAARAIRGQRSPHIRKILVARRCRLGDLVTVLPMLRALRKRYPGARIVFGVHAGFSAAPLLTDSGLVDDIRVLDHFDAPSRLRRLAGAVRLFAEGYDLVVSGGRYFLMLEALMCGAPIRIGLENGAALQQLNTRVLRLDPTRHEADNNVALVEAIGADVAPEDRIPSLEAEPRAIQAAGALLRELGIPAGAPVLAVHPGAQKPSRRWPLERLGIAIARLLASRPNLHVVFTGIPDETPLIEAVRAALPPGLRSRAVSTTGRTDLALMMGVLHRCDALLCNDTGIMHVARAQGVPLVALLGPENHRRWGPYPVGRAPALALRNVVPCAPCTRWDCTPLYCLRSLQAEEIVQAVAEVLDSGRRSAPRLEPLRIQLRERSWEALSADYAVPTACVRLHVRADQPEDTLGDRIARTVQSIAWQTYPRVEMVLVSHAERIDRDELLNVARTAAGDRPVRWADADGQSESASSGPVELLDIHAGATWPRWHLAQYIGHRVRVAAAEPTERSIQGEGVAASVVTVPVELTRRSRPIGALDPAQAPPAH